MRGFVYPLAPLMQRNKWQLDAALSRMAESQRKLEKLRSELQALESEKMDVLTDIRAAQASQINPVGSQGALVYLGRIHDSILRQLQQINDAESELRLRQTAVLDAQIKLEVIKKHRENKLEEFVVAENTKMSAEADSHWLVRSEWLLRAELNENPQGVQP